MFRYRNIRVYPRLCGGTYAGVCGGRGGWGLSPPVRGNQGRTMGRRKIKGSIPACAGEPLMQERAAEAAAVYPRLCGGTSIMVDCERHIEGLSPPVRGNPVRSGGG